MNGYWALNIPGAWIDAPRRFEWERVPGSSALVGRGLGPFVGYRAAVGLPPFSVSFHWSASFEGSTIGTGCLLRQGEQAAMIETEYQAWRHVNGL